MPANAAAILRLHQAAEANPEFTFDQILSTVGDFCLWEALALVALPFCDRCSLAEKRRRIRGRHVGMAVRLAPPHENQAPPMVGDCYDMTLSRRTAACSEYEPSAAKHNGTNILNT